MMDQEELREAILQTITGQQAVTTNHILDKVSADLGVNKGQVLFVTMDLIENGELKYDKHMGVSLPKEPA